MYNIQRFALTVLDISYSKKLPLCIAEIHHVYQSAGSKKIKCGGNIVGSSYLPKSKKGLLREACECCGNGENEGGQAKSGMERYERSPEPGGGTVAAQQEQEAEEPHNELRTINK